MECCGCEWIGVESIAVENKTKGLGVSSNLFNCLFLALKLNKETAPRLVLDIGDDIVIAGDENSSFQCALLRLVVALTSPGFNIPKRAFTKFPPPVFLLIKSLFLLPFSSIYEKPPSSVSPVNRCALPSHLCNSPRRQTLNQRSYLNALLYPVLCL